MLSSVYSSLLQPLMLLCFPSLFSWSPFPSLSIYLSLSVSFSLFQPLFASIFENKEYILSEAKNDKSRVACLSLFRVGPCPNGSSASSSRVPLSPFLFLDSLCFALSFCLASSPRAFSLLPFSSLSFGGKK